MPEAPAVPKMTLLPEVSAVSTALEDEEFWIWKPVTELVLKLLAAVKVLAAFFKGTLEDSLASFKVPEDTLLAFREVSPEPSPLKELEALEKVLAPVKVWVALSLARLESLERLAELIWTPLIW
jgi:hypothetical protein